MNFAVVGAGVVGLTIAKELLARFPKANLELYDAFSIPSKGTSIRNSGVLHAGLYYQPNSLKARLCSAGSSLLVDYIHVNKLPVLNCGKILVPHTAEDVQSLYAIKSRADSNGCIAHLIHYEDALQKQPNIARRDLYLWSPNTKVFSPFHILGHLHFELLQLGANLFTERVVGIDSDHTILTLKSGASKRYDYIFNVAGPGALRLYQAEHSDLNRLALLPILGQYAVLTNGPEICTNLYPVPDPRSPFLGVHVTPRASCLLPILGPNAIPFFRSYFDEYESDDLINFLPRLGVEAAMFLTNSCNFRDHACSELAFSAQRKFYANTIRFFDQSARSSVAIQMTSSIYGIRPQLVDIDRLHFVDDFICRTHNNTLHVVNAVSPAFTSSMALAKHLVDMMA